MDSARLSRVLCRLLAVTAAFVMLVVAFALPASAQFDAELSDARTPFGGVNGLIHAVAIVGDEIWVGGAFTTAYEPDGSGASARSNLARFDYNDGSLLGPLPDANGTVHAIAFDGVDTMYLGGEFTSIGGAATPNIAAISAFTGRPRAGFASGADGYVYDLVWHNDALYVAGEFTSWFGGNGANLIRIDSESGDRDSSFSPTPHDKVWDIAIQGNRIYAAGFFENVGSYVTPTPRNWAAGFDVVTGAPAGPDLSLPPLAPGEGGHKAEARAIGASPDGTKVFIGDDRNIIRAIDVASGAELWAYESEGDIQAIGVSDELVFVGNHQGWFAKFDGRDLVALDQTTGAISTAWEPVLDTTDPDGILNIVVTDDVVIGAGEFDVVNGIPVYNLAVFRTSAWTPLDALEPPVLGDVNCDEQVTLLDALFIAQHAAGTRAESGCPLADVLSDIATDAADPNDDGVIDTADAAMILQCRAGVSNSLCP